MSASPVIATTKLANSAAKLADTSAATVIAATADNPDVGTAHDRLLGLVLSAGISAGFWVAVLALGLPYVGITPNTAALVATGASIASVVTTTLIALNCSN